MTEMVSRVIGSVFLVVAGLVGLTIVFGSWYSIDQGERGVVLRNGAYIATAQPGLNFKIPIVDGVQKVSIREHAQLYENVEAYSRDQQPAVMRMSVNFYVPEGSVSHVYNQYGGLDSMVSRILDRRVYEITKTVFGQFNAVTAIQDRARLNMEVTDAIASEIAEAAGGAMVVTGIQIEDISFSSAYEESIEQRMLAEVEVQKIRQNAEREKVQAEIKVIQAQATADAVRATAQANADAIRMKGDAEAQAIQAKGSALRDNPSLVSLVQAERWDGNLPRTMVPGTTVPFLNMGSGTTEETK